MFLKILIILGIICSFICCIEMWLRTNYYLTEEQEKCAKNTKVRFKVSTRPEYPRKQFEVGHKDSITY